MALFCQINTVQWFSISTFWKWSISGQASMHIWIRIVSCMYVCMHAIRITNILHPLMYCNTYSIDAFILILVANVTIINISNGSTIHLLTNNPDLFWKRTLIMYCSMNHLPFPSWHDLKLPKTKAGGTCLSHISKILDKLIHTISMTPFKSVHPHPVVSSESIVCEYGV